MAHNHNSYLIFADEDVAAKTITKIDRLMSFFNIPDFSASRLRNELERAGNFRSLLEQAVFSQYRYFVW
jgi:hypothetical protein